MRCRDVRDVADSFLIDELPSEAEQDVRRHVQACPACSADMDARRRLRASLRTAFDQVHELKARPEFARELRETLRMAALAAPRPRARPSSGWRALAAAVLLAVGLAGALWARDRSASRALVRAAVGNHRNCALDFRLAEKPIPLGEAAARYDAVYRVLETLPPDEIHTTVGAARVLERHACVFAGRRFAHLVLEYHGARISLLVTANDGLRLFTASAAARSSGVERVDAMPIVSIRASRHTIFLTGDLAPSDLARLADAVAGPLSRQLA